MKTYKYTKTLQVTDTFQVKPTVPSPLIRDFWNLKPGDSVVVDVRKIGNRLVFTVEPMK